MTTESTSAIGPETPFTFLRAPAENSRPSVSMRKTMPSCPIVGMELPSERKLPPQVWRLMRMPASR